MDGASTSRLYPPGPLIHPSSSAAALAFRVNRAYVRRLLHFTKYKTILFVRRYLAALIKLSLLSSPISPFGSSKPQVIMSCPKLHQGAGNAGSSFRPRCTFLNGCLTNTGTSRRQLCAFSVETLGGCIFLVTPQPVSSLCQAGQARMRYSAKI